MPRDIFQKLPWFRRYGVRMTLNTARFKVHTSECQNVTLKVRKAISAQNCTFKARLWLVPFEPIGAKDLSLTFGSMQVKRFPSRFQSFCRQLITVMILRYFSHSLLREDLYILLSFLFFFVRQTQEWRIKFESHVFDSNITKDISIRLYLSDW